MKFHIQLFGVNELGETCSIVMREYNPLFYVKCGDNWEQSNVDIFLIVTQNKENPYCKRSIVKAELVKYNKLYGFTAGGKSKFIKITF